MIGTNEMPSITSAILLFTACTLFVIDQCVNAESDESGEQHREPVSITDDRVQGLKSDDMQDAGTDAYSIMRGSKAI